MMTPSTMTTSMITIATTMMTNVVVAPSLGELLVGCELLLTGTIVVVVPTILVGCVLLLTEAVMTVAVLTGTVLTVAVLNG